MSDAIRTDALTKYYGAVVGLEALDLRVAAGEVYGFLGPNGAGKTTTLRMLLGLVAPSGGTATFGGKRYDELSEPVRDAIPRVIERPVDNGSPNGGHSASRARQEGAAARRGRPGGRRLAKRLARPTRR